MGAGGRHGDEGLLPYVPRLVTEWLVQTPEALHREIDGSVVFVDISGFTRLSERLASQGKVGAEELTEAIGACFSRLLGVAYGNGGGLIKFGGDALLLLFRGPDHELKACRAAGGMRRALGEIGSLSCPGGRVRLRMSVGVHRGTFDFFLVGDSHRELIITGPAATETVIMESTAEAGEIVVSSAVAGALPRAAVGEAKGTGRLLKREPPGLSGRDADLDDAVMVDVLSCIPAALRGQVAADWREPEHKRVTVAFVHFDGTDELITAGGRQVAANALHQLVSDVQRAADHHDVCFLGSDIDRDGGKLILTAGAPTSSGNDEERMLLTLREIAEAERTIPVRIGVNRGHVFAGDIGPPYRRTYTVMGDAVNLAARVMAKAAPGDVLATEDVLSHCRTQFKTTELEPFTVKGKVKSVQAFRVEAATGTAALESWAELPLVGREHEMQSLGAALAAVRAGDGRLVEIVGEAGIGKSRLVQELRQHAADVRQLSVACELYESSTPYYPFRALLRSVLGIADDADDKAVARRLRQVIKRTAPNLLPWAPLVGTALGVELAPTPEVRHLEDEFKRTQLEATVSELLAAMLVAPTLITIEDGHWMDEASAELLRRLEVDLAARPWLVCVTRRETSAGFVASGAPHIETLRPRPLDEQAATMLAEVATEDAPLAPHDIAALVRRSAGNPLFLHELLAAARAAGTIEGLPDSVEALITARVDRLAPDDRTMLRRLSVLGHSFDKRLVSAVLPDGAGGDGLVRRLGAFVVEDEETFRFHHLLIRDAAYETLPYRVRRTLHAAVADTIEAGAVEPADEAEVLSFHFFHAGWYAKAWEYSRAAAERARAIYANVEAAEFYERALAAARRDEHLGGAEVAAVYETLGDVRKRMGEYPQAEAAYRAGRRLLRHDPISVARLMMNQGEVHVLAGRFADARRWLARARKAIDGLPGRDATCHRAQVAVACASAWMGQGRPRAAIRWCRNAQAEAEPVGDKKALAKAYMLLDLAFVNLGQWDKVIHSRRALELYEELNDLSAQGMVLNNLGGYAYLQGRWNEALELYDRGRAAREKVGDAVNAVQGTNNVAEILSDQGRLDEAEPLFRRALRVFRAAGDQANVAYALSNLGRLEARRGRFDEAMALLEEARSAFRGLGTESAQYAVETDARVAECLALQGEHEAALAVVAGMLERAKPPGGGLAAPLLHRVRGWVLRELGDSDGAATSFEQSLQAARAIGADYEAALTLHAIGDDDAQPIFDRLGVVRVPQPLVAPLP